MNVSHAMRRLTLVLLLLAIALAASDLLVSAVSVVLLILAGVLFGIFLNGLSRFIPLPYRWSYVIVITVLVLLIALAIFYMGSQIGQQLAQLSDQLQSASQQFIDRLKQYEWGRQSLADSSQLQEMVTGGGGAVFSQVMQGMGWLIWGMTGMLVIFFVGLYVAYDPDLYKGGIIKLITRAHRPRAEEVLGTLRRSLGRWIAARIFSMSVVGILTAIGLWMLGVPLPIPLGIVAALLTFIPNVGPVLATLPQALLASQVGTNTILFVILFNIGLQTVESYLLSPIVERYEVTLPPALTIFVQLLMSVLFGVIGIMMAAPLTVAAMVLVQMLYVRDTLDDPHPGELVEQN